MRSCSFAVVVAAAALTCSGALAVVAHSDPLKASKVVGSDLFPPLEPTVEDENCHKRLLRTDEDDNPEERAINPATFARMDENWKDAVLRAAYQHWFEGGKTKADVRLMMGLPAKGEAVSYANWGKYLKYLEFLSEKELAAANAAKVAAIKQKLIYKGWFLDGKTIQQVRVTLGLPATGEAKAYANWQTYLGYLKFYREYSKQVILG
ncbi:hypothetical protein PHYPSEUDO_003150 [Phytophthora pseudosyringae]|uniref:RxLR effector protein n=1 Tax=Phytophthora pseudosyringae TaxID=221518 RepID=A0A8T1VS45_9STRA|nr:hypothetical protein PHYPSEUDO_003150 [Phytophthora pseudosyringae]